MEDVHRSRQNLLLMGALQLSIRQPFNSMPAPPSSMLAPEVLIAANEKILVLRLLQIHKDQHQDM